MDPSVHTAQIFRTFHFGRNGSANKTIIVYHMQHKNDRDFFWKYIEFFCVLHVKILL